MLGAVHESQGNSSRAREFYVESARLLPAASYHTWGTSGPLSRPLYRAVLESLRDGVGRAPDFERSTLHLEIGKFARAQGDIDTALSTVFVNGIFNFHPSDNIVSYFLVGIGDATLEFDFGGDRR